MRILKTVVLASIFLVIVVGCQSTENFDEQIQDLKLERKQLARQVEQEEAKNTRLKKQIDVLTGLGPILSSENLYEIEQVRVGRFTDLYDKDKDGRKEKLIVYIQPIDKNGDIIKAAGVVDVQLWDLHNENGQALLGEWHVDAASLKKLWFRTLISINYRLIFDVGDKVKSFDEPLTVKATFTDYLSGGVFEVQKVIKP